MQLLHARSTKAVDFNHAAKWRRNGIGRPIGEHVERKGAKGGEERCGAFARRVTTIWGLLAERRIVTRQRILSWYARTLNMCGVILLHARANSLQEGILAGKMLVDSSLRNADLACDITHGGTLVAIAREEAKRRQEDRLACSGGA